jgi:hypothetical protein
MPHATASWLVDNSSLTFQQIAEFCGLHILEIQAIADDTAATKLTGRDPIRAGELTQDEIERGQADPSYRLRMFKEPDQVRRTKGPALHAGLEAPGQAGRHRLDHPQPSEISDGQIGKLIGTDAHDDRGDPRPLALEHLQHHAEGPGDARPVLAARARRACRQGGEGGGAMSLRRMTGVWPAIARH